MYSEGKDNLRHLFYSAPHSLGASYPGEAFKGANILTLYLNGLQYGMVEVLVEDRIKLLHNVEILL